MSQEKNVSHWLMTELKRGVFNLPFAACTTEDTETIHLAGEETEETNVHYYRSV